MKDIEMWAKHISRIHQHIEEGIRTLNGLWNEMGLTKESMHTRMDLVEMHCQDMFKTMVEEEEEYKSRLVKEVKHHTEEIRKLALDLEEDISLDENWASLVIAENELKSKLENLQKIKKDRFDTYWEYKAKDKTLSFRLGAEEYPGNDAKIPKAEYLEDFKRNLASKQVELDRIEKVYVEKRSIILALMSELEIEATTPLERNIAAKDMSTIRMTKDFLNSVQRRHQELVQESQDRKELAIQLRETLSLLWDRLCVSPSVREAFHENHPGHGVRTIDALRKEIKRCEELKRQNIKQFIEKLRCEIKDLKKMCLCGDGYEGLGKHAIESTSYTEELLELHELEVKKLQKEAEESKQVLETLEKWNKLFSKQVDLDEKADDPERLFGNRGGQLLKEEKERKAIQKELPKVEAILKKHYKAWCESHGRTYLHDGVELLDYIDSRWKNYHDQKEKEKLERKRAKELLLDQEAKMGTHASGNKRKFVATPGKSPATKSHCLEPLSSNNRMRLRTTNDNGLAKVSQRLFEKVTGDDDEENKLGIPLNQENANNSITSSLATYADFTHHLEIISKDANIRSSTLPEVAKACERRPTPLRPANIPKLVAINSPMTSKPTSSTKTPVSAMRTPSKVRSRTPGYTPSRTPLSTNSRNLRSAAKSRTGTPKFTPRPFLV